ncbi:MAG: hypothetical protein K0S74_1868 [Chlamydiales bacterium]|jgi:hypothetical protein|nr:hypothetical protein [Chlamydiales bacterium]
MLEFGLDDDQFLIEQYFDIFGLLLQHPKVQASLSEEDKARLQQ